MKSKEKTPAKGAKTPVKGKEKPAQLTRRGKKNLQKKPAENIFAGATEISMTENKIAVTRSSSKSSNGKYSERTTRVYHERTPANEKALKEAITNGGVKKVTVKLK